ncbi:hypothetical protein AHF37_04695, partial [Paragonimus kellicotti]
FYPGRNNSIKNDNPFLYSSRSFKSGIIHNEKNLCNHVEELGSQPANQFGTRLHENWPNTHPKLLSRPRLLPKFDFIAPVILQERKCQPTRHLTSCGLKSLAVDLDEHLAETVASKLLLKATSTEKLLHRKSLSTNVKYLGKNKPYTGRSYFETNKGRVVKSYEEMKQEVERFRFEMSEERQTPQVNYDNCVLGRTDPIKSAEKDCVKVYSHSQPYYAVSVRSLTAQTVVLLRSQTQLFLRDTCSAKNTSHNQSILNTNSMSGETKISLPLSHCPSLDQNVAVTSVPAVHNRGTVHISATDSCETKAHEIPISSAPTCASPKQIELDSGNGSDDEEENVLKAWGSLIDEDHHSAQDVASESSGIVHSDNSFTDTEDCQSNEEAVLSTSDESCSSPDEELSDTEHRSIRKHPEVTTLRASRQDGNESRNATLKHTVASDMLVKSCADAVLILAQNRIPPCSTASTPDKRIQTVPMGSHKVGQKEADKNTTLLSTKNTDVPKDLIRDTSKSATDAISTQKSNWEPSRSLPNDTKAEKTSIVKQKFENMRNSINESHLTPPSSGKEVNSKSCKANAIRAWKTQAKVSHPALIDSLFPNVPPVLRFVEDGQKLESLPWEFRRLLRWRASMLTPVVVKQALMRSGFRVSKLTTASEDLETIESSDWIFYFGKHMRPQVFRSIKEYQKVFLNDN